MSERRLQRLLGRVLRRAWRWVGQYPAVQTAAAQMRADLATVDIPEVTAMAARPSAMVRPRLNLLVPTIRPTHVFGGISTALHFFEKLKGLDVDVRVIVTDDNYQPDPLPSTLQGWTVRSAAEEDSEGRMVVFFASRTGATLSVRAGDIFVATAWWTAYVVQRLLPWQAEHYGGDRLPLVYLVQDHEPGFYALSSRYLMARSTYEYDGPMIAVFNTSLLSDYFLRQEYSFIKHYAFEPEMHPMLAKVRQQGGPLTKERRLILYGRPGVARNAFEMVCQGVREWSRQCPDSALWRIESLGELHQDIDLHHGARIVCRGKLSLEEYAQTLSCAAVGVSLMLSPHPSYPPLEMAEFGVRVVTNSFENKDLGARSPLIHSLGCVTPEKIAEALHLLTAPWHEEEKVQVEYATRSLFVPPGESFAFVPQLRRDLRLDEGMPDVTLARMRPETQSMG